MLVKVNMVVSVAQSTKIVSTLSAIRDGKVIKEVTDTHLHLNSNIHSSQNCINIRGIIHVLDLVLKEQRINTDVQLSINAPSLVSKINTAIEKDFISKRSRLYSDIMFLFDKISEFKSFSISNS